MIASGGGTKNPVMMALLDRALGDIAFKRLDDLGMASEAKEAVAFAILACQTVNGQPGNVPSVTGADKQVVLGSITPGGETSIRRWTQMKSKAREAGN